MLHLDHIGTLTHSSVCMMQKHLLSVHCVLSIMGFCLRKRIFSLSHTHTQHWPALLLLLLLPIYKAVAAIFVDAIICRTFMLISASFLFCCVSLTLSADTANWHDHHDERVNLHMIHGVCVFFFMLTCIRFIARFFRCDVGGHGSLGLKGKKNEKSLLGGYCCGLAFADNREENAILHTSKGLHIQNIYTQTHTHTNRNTLAGPRFGRFYDIQVKANLHVM